MEELIATPIKADMVKVSESYKYNGLYVSVEYKNGDMYDITLQEPDGCVLFSGSPRQLLAIAETANALLND